ncbi:unnamed protein product [Clonostachys rosea f. rosea IK726]|uniref:Uncharacterized protein n=1 Tax=Clonostachys rosea f. rosea IK726 TaxID=1349383 RepID=A0ACA9UUL3_BIOOC|nr:unnamed protein product [Clonostachys rosea f. rosea IK726]
MISLNQIMACSSPMYNAQLIAILGQIIDGLVYLNKESFSHGDVDFRSILVNRKGIIRLDSFWLTKKSWGEYQIAAMVAFTDISVQRFYKRDIANFEL